MRIGITPANLVIIASVSLLALPAAKWASAWMSTTDISFIKDVGKAMQYVLNAA